MPTPRAQIHKPSYLAASIVALAVLALYVVTLAPTTAMWDTSEYITAAYTLGLPHPPGNPLFVLLGRVFSLLPIAPNVAMRINLLAAISSAVTAGIWFLITERVLATWIEEKWVRITGGAVAALIGATAFTVWSQSVVNEKVYTVSLVGLAIVSWLMVRWCDDPDRPGAHKLLVLAAYLMGLGYANHMAGMLTLPAAGIAILARRPKTILRWRLMLACAGALLLGATPFATQPIRSSHFPAINEGETTGCKTAIAVSCVFSKETYERFMYNFNREQYGKPSTAVRQAPFSAQLGMWWLYFKWQWWRAPTAVGSSVQTFLAYTFLALGVLGAWAHWKRDRVTFAFFAPLMATLTVVLIYYLNFKYGASQASAEFCNSGDPSPCEVRDRDYFFIWSFSAFAVWAAVGLVDVWRSLASAVQSSTGAATRTRRTGWAMAAPVLAVALIPLFGNWTSASRKLDTDTADWARDLLNSVEPYGILVTAGDNDMFPLWYAQEVEGIRKDVILANTSLLNTQWFVRQMIRRPQFTYDTDTGPALYKAKQWVRPAKPVLAMSIDEADTVPDWTEIRQPMQFVAGEVKTTLQPQILTRADLLVYKLIQDNPERTVHFAASTANYPDRLGLTDYVSMHGLTRKLEKRPIVETDTMKRDRGNGEWVDVAASKALWDSFDAPASLIRKNLWVDRPSVSVPLAYVRTGFALSDTMLQRGDATGAADVMDRVRGVATAVGFGDAFRQATTPQGILGDSVAPAVVPVTPAGPRRR